MNEKMNVPGKKSNKIIATILIIITCFSFYPIIWLFLGSFKTTNELLVGQSWGWPKEFTVENYIKVFADGSMLRYFVNSVIVTATVIFLTILFASMFAYSLSRMKWRGQDKMYLFTTVSMLVPSAIVIVPVFILMKKLGLIDTLWSLILILVAFNMGRSVIISYGFLRGIPDSIEEAAVIDGCGLFRIFFSIIVPLLKPAFLMMAIYVFLNAWNEYIWAMILISKDAFKTLPVGMMKFVTERGTDWGCIFAAMAVSSCIPIILFGIFNKKFENALTAGEISK